MYYVSRIAAAFILAALFAASGFSIRLAQAEANFAKRNPKSVARAIEIMPRNTEYLAFRALELDYDGADSTPLLERMASLNPLASAPRIQLGLAAEIHGDSESAERWLLEAARIDRQFEPRWTLANFYFRHENPAEFWKWIRLALQVSYGDRRPAFDLCWRISEDPQEILTRAIPERGDVAAAYLAYLLEERRLPAAVTVALKLAAAGDPNDRQLLLTACDALIDAGDAASSSELWHAMGYPAPSGITAGDFEAPRIGHGFDWRIFDAPGVSHRALDAPPAHRVALNGQQPEACELLRQIVSLEPRARYVLEWEARTQSLSSPSGLEWRIAGDHAPIGSQDDWRAGALSFIAPSNLTALSLAYQRPSGEVRAEGWVELRHVRIHASAGDTR